MRTTKPVSTISYNSPAFLKLKLEELTASKKVSFWAFIEHNPEPDEAKDEAGKKKHIHLYIEPAKMLQTEDLKGFFAEPDPEKPDKPKSCIFFNSSKFGDWYLYGLHDKAYLAYKHQSRVHHYKAEQMVTSDADEMNARVQQIDMMDITPYMKIMESISQGLTWDEFVSSARVPLPMLGAYRIAFDALLTSTLNRNGHSGHEKPEEEEKRPKPSIVYSDPVTGEVIEQFQIDPDEPEQ